MKRLRLIVLAAVPVVLLLAVFIASQTGAFSRLPSPPSGTVPEAVMRVAIAGVDRNAEWTPVVRVVGGLAMALVPSGCFAMGSTDAELEAAVDSCERFYGRGKCPHDFASMEQPVHRVCFETPFWIGRTEVSNREYGSSSSTDMETMYRGPHWPRESVNWDEARRFCAGRGLRLPTEAEWEYAARGPDGLIYPWGNEFDLEKVVSGRLSPEDVGFHRQVVSWVGAYDLSGGIAEWAADAVAPYSLHPSTADLSGGMRVVRGGSWFSFAAFLLRGAHREAFEPDHATSVIGVRCAGDLEP